MTRLLSIYRKKDSLNKDDYRTVSILQMTKVFERFIYS